MTPLHQHQDEAEAAALRCPRQFPPDETVAKECFCGRDRNGREGGAAADFEFALSKQLTHIVKLNGVAGVASRFPSAIHQASACAEIDGGKPFGTIEI